jgi:hypothetical protein
MGGMKAAMPASRRTIRTCFAACGTPILFRLADLLEFNEFGIGDEMPYLTGRPGPRTVRQLFLTLCEIDGSETFSKNVGVTTEWA